MKAFSRDFTVFVFGWFVVSLLGSMVMPCFAVYSVGVKAGDWIKYQGTASGLGPNEFLGLSSMDWMKAEVQSVSDNTVTVQMTARYKNGSESVQMLVGDVVSGSGNLTFLMMPAGLEKGDSLPFAMFDLGQVSMIVNDTVPRSYLGASRTVNALGLSVSEVYASVNVHAYWDKATGVLMELSMQVNSTFGQNMQMQMSIEAIETNMWSAELLGGGVSGVFGDNLIYIVGVAAVVVAVVAFVLLRRTRRPVPFSASPVSAPMPADLKTA